MLGRMEEFEACLCVSQIKEARTDLKLADNNWARAKVKGEGRQRHASAFIPI